MTTLRRSGIILRGLLALTVLILLLAGVPVLLISTVGNPIPDQWAWTEPMSATAVLGVLALVAWVLWTQLVVCVLVEAIAEVRVATGRSADWLARVPGTLGGQQALARNLIRAVVAIGVTSTALGPGAALLERAHAEPALVAIEPKRPTAPQPQGPIVEAAPKHRATTNVTVQRGDTLWSLAEQHLGSGEQWREIAALNTGRTMIDGTVFNDAHTIVPGWTLAVPAQSSTAGDTITVEPGDTLWGIAEKQYGDGAKWPRIYRANNSVIDDPHWIYVGEELTVPKQGDAGAESEEASVRDRTGQTEQEATENRDPKPPHEPTPEQTEAPDIETDHDPAPSVPDVGSTRDDSDSAAPTILRAFAGAGAMLACFLLAGYTARRRAQVRRRRSGRVVAATKPGNINVEKALRTAGSTVADDVAVLDGALRGLVGIPGGVPDVAAVRLSPDEVELVLAHPRTDAAAPWESNQTGERWTVSRARLKAATGGPAPFPTLVCLGEDVAGSAWFLDLEAAGIVTLTGDKQTSTDAARFIAAELAANRWSDTVHLVCVGVERELGHIDPDRIDFIAEPDPEILVKRATRIQEIKESNGIDVLEGRSDPNLGDNWTPTVLVAACDIAASDTVTLDDLSDLLAIGRSAVALVGTSVQRVGVGLTIEVSDDGTADIGWAQVRLNRLTSDEAIAIGTAFADLDADDEYAPSDETSEYGVNAGLSDALGALRRGMIDERGDAGGPESLLPEADEVYINAAATTTEDLQVLAPPVRADAVENMDELDPTLDAEIEAWFDPTSPTPKLRVLGPIELQVDRQIPERAKSRVAYLTEVCGYLACHPGGSTAQQMAEAFFVQPGTIHKRLEELRLWLGEDPSTGRPRVPEAKLSAPGTTRGVGNYVVTGVLHDADLFRRLRIRAQLRGSNGVEDLATALRLVEGQPFDQQRIGGYGWLVEAGTDHHLAAAVVDVAHLVATDALAAGKPGQAEWAASLGILASPYEDKPRLDLVAAKRAMGDAAEAEALLRASVLNRSDDGFAPPDQSQPVLEMLRRRSAGKTET